VHGALAALELMRPRNEGTIVSVSSALAHRSIPLQVAYCGAKAAARAFFEGLRTELIHEHSAIRISQVVLPAINTPQFLWSSSKMPYAPRPVAPVYATEGSPLIVGPTGMFKAAPNPNAAKLFCNYSFSAECQQLIIDIGGLRSMHPHTKEKAGRKPFKDIKTMKDDPAAVEKMADEIKRHYVQLFHV